MNRSSSSIRSGSVWLCSFIPRMIFRGTPIPQARHDTAAERSRRAELIVDAWPGLTLPQIDAAACYARAYPWRGRARTAPAWRSRVPVASGEAALDVLPELR